MNLRRDALVQILATRLPKSLAEALVDEFIQIRVDVATRSLGRSSPGKFVENLVKALQHLDTGQFDKKPDVDEYLRKLDSKASSLDDGLKVCASRIGRSMYTLRNKRNIAHAGDVDPNEYDLRFLLHAAQWVLAEMVRFIGGSTMKDAGRLVDEIQAPVGGLVDDLGGQKVVHGNLNAPDEVLVLLHHAHPDPVSGEDIRAAMRRRGASTVRNAVRQQWREKLIEESEDGYRLTSVGYARAGEVIVAAQSA